MGPDDYLVDLISSAEWKAYKNIYVDPIRVELTSKIMIPAKIFPDDLWKKEQYSSALRMLEELIGGVEVRVNHYLNKARLKGRGG